MPLVSLWGVAVRRGSSAAEHPVLDHLQLVIEAGELTVVTGLRGAGKSTLLAVVAGALRPEAGEVAIAGRNLVALQVGSLPYVRRNIGYLPPEPPFLRDETVLENVMLALAARGQTPAEAEAAARQSLADLDLEALADREVETLSAPERRMCAIARALVGSPPVVVLDDPALGCDERDCRRLVAALGRARAAGSAILCALGEASWVAALAAAGARVLELRDGRLSGSGPVLRLLDATAASQVARQERADRQERSERQDPRPERGDRLKDPPGSPAREAS